ncbi:MAG: cytochrome b/b6 domain-containing protein [Halieaceae bacterium]|jgi:cytochrome b|nr:cytochrome b/b6 domain-containing protein [Halieaceae bacterium]
MSTTTTVAAATDFKPKSEPLRVWDPLVRIFHWSLVVGFATAFLVEDDLLAVHVWAGYLVLTLIAVRLVWGLIGPRYARFGDFVRGPRQVGGYLAAVLRGRAPRYLGHNPAGGAMVVALLLAVTATGLSGLALFGAQELSGPLAPLMSGLPRGWGHTLEEVHEVLANFTLALIVAHIAGVVFSSLAHRENLVRAMVTGTKRKDAR